MKKTHIVLCLLIIIILIIIGTVLFNNSVEKNQVQIGNTIFSMPSGYSIRQSNETEANITNGFNTIIISKCNNNTIQKQIDDYKTLKEKDNNTIYVTNITINNLIVYKATVTNNTSYIHYWFKYNDETYTVYSWNANKNMDEIVSELINKSNIH